MVSCCSFFKYNSWTKGYREDRIAYSWFWGNLTYIWCIICKKNCFLRKNSLSPERHIYFKTLKLHKKYTVKVAKPRHTNVSKDALPVGAKKKCVKVVGGGGELVFFKCNRPELWASSLQKIIFELHLRYCKQKITKILRSFYLGWWASKNENALLFSKFSKSLQKLGFNISILDILLLRSWKNSIIFATLKWVSAFKAHSERWSRGCYRLSR